MYQQRAPREILNGFGITFTGLVRLSLLLFCKTLSSVKRIRPVCIVKVSFNSSTSLTKLNGMGVAAPECNGGLQRTARRIEPTITGFAFKISFVSTVA